MRAARIKIPSSSGQADYLCSSKTISGEWLFEDDEKKKFREQLWQVADFCGVKVLTYTVLSNHFHVVVRVPQAAPVTDTELLRRFQVLHPDATRWSPARLEAIGGTSCRPPIANACLAWAEQRATAPGLSR